MPLSGRRAKAGSIRPRAQGAGGREREAEAAAGRGHARQRRAQGSRAKKLTSPGARREAALRLIAERGFSQRHACGLVMVDPKTVRRRVVPDAPELRQRLRELAGERRRFGYRRLGFCSSARACA